MICDGMICAGFGFRSEVSEACLEDVFSQICELHNVTGTIKSCATVTSKANSLAFQGFAQHQNLTIVALSLDQIAGQKPLSYSALSSKLYGTGSVAEASALAGAGDGATLLGPRIISHSGKATCAIAKGATT